MHVSPPLIWPYYSPMQEHMLHMQALDQRAQETNMENWLNPHCPPRCDRNYGHPVWWWWRQKSPQVSTFISKPQMHTVHEYNPLHIQSPIIWLQSFLFQNDTNVWNDRLLINSQLMSPFFSFLKGHKRLLLQGLSKVHLHLNFWTLSFFGLCTLSYVFWCWYFLMASLLFLFLSSVILSHQHSRKPQKPAKALSESGSYNVIFLTLSDVSFKSSQTGLKSAVFPS